MALWRYDRIEAVFLSYLPAVMTIITFIHHGIFPLRRSGELRAHVVKPRHVMALSSRQHDGYACLFIDTSSVDFGGKAPPRTSQSLCGLAAVFFNAPAACWWARILVLSIKICFAILQSFAWSLSHNFFQRPRASHLLNRLYTASQWPKASGKSRQGMPVRARYNTASINMRSLCAGGLPALCLIASKMVPISAQAASVSTSLMLVIPFPHDKITHHRGQDTYSLCNSSTRPRCLVPGCDGTDC
jgi:hypothetical protein